jgi:hypothetical protein
MQQIEIAGGLDKLMMVYHSAVYFIDQDCPHALELDGVDRSAVSFIGFGDDNPAGCLRAQFFAGFAKLVQVFVHKLFCRWTLAFDLARADGLSLKSRPIVILCPEGDWDRPAVFEDSRNRELQTPS